MSSSALSLRPVTLRLPRGPGSLLVQIETALAAEGQPLRWAIVAVEPAAASTLDVVLTIEAVVLA
ncbi:hypothetical protein KBY65_02955 [Cyanobium sp. Alchichica 3B3-8F6]|uniref:hypothetical protein n=1 Tax=unclassified Cyanobium TaxID=2627006 RepID=UPI0020CF6A9D|nr:MULTISPECIES: hypothetical protein [unclassified Cyanobium]MCP9881440.1 hypothetical protein [Cyanobium sp. Alchichica 3B3-8F6]MCP9942912.1 hypothetical protein [Cyanobium sp. ATX 6E8]